MRTIWTGYITLLQLALVISAVALAFATPAATSFGLSVSRLRRLCSRHVVCGVVAAFLPLAIRFILLPSIPIPAPAVQEEFSDLLQADTFAHGRLANPPHPMSVFFDTCTSFSTRLMLRRGCRELLCFSGRERLCFMSRGSEYASLLRRCAVHFTGCCLGGRDRCGPSCAPFSSGCGSEISLTG